MIDKKRYAYSLNGENYYGEFEDEEELITAAIDEYLDENEDSFLEAYEVDSRRGLTVYKGALLQYEPYESFNVNNIIEDIAGTLYEEVDNDKLQEWKDKTIDLLKDKERRRDISKGIYHILDEHGLYPDFEICRTTSTIEIPFSKIKLHIEETAIASKNYLILLKKAEELLEDRDMAIGWINSPRVVFKKRTPKDLSRTNEGLEEVLDLLESIKEKGLL